ncbi:MAG: hypothetical protein IT384_27490 [Deltaproteobacteria bacterium]|nr:hypothetical protein [Deltaproteobacteria bacterium]
MTCQWSDRSRFLLRARWLFLLGSTALLPACAADLARLVPANTEVIVGPAGGRATSPDGKFVLSVSAGSLTAPTAIRIAEDHETRLDGLQSVIYVVGPRELELPAEIAIRVSAHAAEVGFVGELQGGVARRLRSSRVNVAETALAADIDGAGSYAVFFTSSSVRADGGISEVCRTDASTLAVPPCGIAEVEPNDSIETAQHVVSGIDRAVDVLARFNGDDDYYQFTLPEGPHASLDVTTFSEVDSYGTCSPGLDLALALYDASHNLILERRSGACSSFSYHGYSALVDLRPGDWFIRVFGRVPAGAPNTYHLALYVLGPDNVTNPADGSVALDDGGGAGDAGGGAGDAGP